MRRPVLLLLCISLAWTLACATAIGSDGERRLWQRQLASTSPKFTLVQTAVTTPAGTTAAVRITAAAATTQDDTTTSVIAPSSSITEAASSSSTSAIPATSSAAAASSASSSSSPAIVFSSRTARQLSAVQSNVAVSSASASSASAKASAAAAKAESSFLQPGNRLFPVAVLMFIAIGELLRSLPSPNPH